MQLLISHSIYLASHFAFTKDTLLSILVATIMFQSSHHQLQIHNYYNGMHVKYINRVIYIIHKKQNNLIDHECQTILATHIKPVYPEYIIVEETKLAVKGTKGNITFSY